MGAQRTVREAWRRHIVGLLDQALERNDAAISDVAAATTTTILAGRHVYAFGAGHSLALVSEMHRRAGSMKAVRPLWNAELTSRIDAEAAGKLENQAGYYKELTGGLDWGPGDLCWVISNSGRNTLVVELALEARRHGVTVVGLVSREHSGIVSAAPGLPKLPEIADYLLDNGGCFGDAALEIPGVAERMEPTSTIVGAALIHAVWAEAGERLAALAMAENLVAGHKTLGADKGYDTHDFVMEVREFGITPHVAQNAYETATAQRRSAIDGRTTRHPGYALSQKKRKRIEEIFGWLKTVGGLRQTKFRGLARVRMAFTFALAAYNLIRMPKLSGASA